MFSFDIQNKTLPISFSTVCRYVCIAILMVCLSQVGAQGTLNLPERASEARGFSEMRSDLESTSGTIRQSLITKEILAGNVPNFLRSFTPVCWNAVTTDSLGTLRTHRVCIHVLRDYLAVGSDTDFIHMPLMPQFAQVIADGTDTTLPTTEMVDHIYQAAFCKIAPSPFSPTKFDIANLSTWILSSERIIEQVTESGYRVGECLTAGIKKDVVVTTRLGELARSPRVAIYGWHRFDNAPIQPLTLVHAATYVDYSHGTRLVSNTISIDGVTTRVDSVLQDSTYWPLLSREGVLTSATLRYPSAAGE